MVSALDPRPPRMRSLDELERAAPRRRHPRIAKLREQPIGELTPETIRALLARREGVRHLLPIALELLEHDPWIESCGQPADLLLVVLGIEALEVPDADNRRRAIVTAAAERMAELAPRDRARVEFQVLRASASLAR